MESNEKINKNKKNKKTKKWVYSFFVGFSFFIILLTAYTNCGQKFETKESQNEKATTLTSSTTTSTTTTTATSTDSSSPINSLSTNSFISSKTLVQLDSSGTEETIGEENSNCMNEDKYDACIVWKNPVASRGGSYYTSYFQMGTDISDIQTFGIKLKNRKKVKALKSSTINVVYIDSKSSISSNGDVEHQALPLSSDGKIKIAYKDELSSKDKKYALAQLTTYFWLDYTQSELKRRTQATDSSFFKYEKASSGIFYMDDIESPITVYSYLRTTVKSDGEKKHIVYNNAYFSPDSDSSNDYIAIGYAAKSAKSKGHELGLNAEISIHEFAHANFYYAQNRKTLTNAKKNEGSLYCNSKMGCIDGMEEGLADFHAIMIFADSPSIGDLFIPKRSLRNVQKLVGKTVQDLYEDTAYKNSKGKTIKGEIHLIGNIYASLLWEIYKNDDLDKRAFEATFLLHLQNLSSSSNYKTSAAKLISIDKEFFNERNSKIIKDVFTSRGVNLE